MVADGDCTDGDVVDGSIAAQPMRDARRRILQLTKR